MKLGTRPELSRVKRVILMVELDGQSSGEAYDLTELVTEMGARSKYGHSSISVSLRQDTDYSAPYPGPGGKRPVKTEISYGGDAGEWVHGAARIEDVVNFSLPDGERVTALRRKAERLQKKSEELKSEAMIAKLMQVSEVRHQHPVARFEIDPSVKAIVAPTENAV